MSISPRLITKFRHLSSVLPAILACVCDCYRQQICLLPFQNFSQTTQRCCLLTRSCQRTCQLSPVMWLCGQMQRKSTLRRLFNSRNFGATVGGNDQTLHKGLAKIVRAIFTNKCAISPVNLIQLFLMLFYNSCVPCHRS